MFKKDQLKVFITDDLYYMNLCEEILEETLDLIVDVQLDSPGNPIFVSSGISKEELKKYYYPHLKKKCV